MGQRQVHDAALGHDHLVRHSVEEVAARAVAAGDAVDAGRDFDLRKAATVGFRGVGGAGGDVLHADDRPFVDGVGITGRVHGVHRQQLQAVRPRTLVVLDAGRDEQGQTYERNPFHSLIRQVSP